MNTAISPLKQLDHRQSEFVRLFVEGAHPRQAALGAGYARATAEAAGEQLLQRPHIALAIARAARPRLAKSLPLALGTLDFLVEKAISERVRLEAAKAILDRCGIVAPRAPDPPAEFEKPIHELTQDQLRALVAKWTASAAAAEHELGNRATLVNIDPEADPADDLVG